MWGLIKDTLLRDRKRSKKAQHLVGIKPKPKRYALQACALLLCYKRCPIVTFHSLIDRLKWELKVPILGLSSTSITQYGLKLGNFELAQAIDESDFNSSMKQH